MIKLKHILVENKIFQYKIYCDMDGVLCDFDGQFAKFSVGEKRAFAASHSNIEAWKLIQSMGEKYWSEMPWMPDGKKLWNFLIPYSPELLTAPSKAGDGSQMIPDKDCVNGKVKLVKRNLGSDVKFNMEWPEEKWKHATENSILIDDKLENIQDWTRAHGIAIHHTSAASSIQQLEKIFGQTELTEMPHVSVGHGVSIDLNVERYPMSDADKREIIHAYNGAGVTAYADKYKKYLLFNNHEIKLVPEPTEVELPSYWELYAVKII